MAAAGGEPDLAAVASAFADPRRVRALLALADGRALPAGRLAEEAGVSASTISNHLAQLLDRGLVSVERQGRNRYYRLATPHVEAVLESLARLAPQKPITSLRESTRARVLRDGRTCYHHLAGRLGVSLFRSMLDRAWIVGGDGRHHAGDRLSAAGRGHQYRLSPAGSAELTAWGLPASTLRRNRPLSYCVDWTEQEHHLAGPLGTAVTEHLFTRGWIVRGRVHRSVQLTEAGRAGLVDLVRAAS